MILERFITGRFLRYRYNQAAPYVPGSPCPPPFSRNAWNIFGVMPDATAVAAAALDGSGTRGVAEFVTEWAPKLGLSWNQAQVACWKSTDPAPANYAPGLVNSTAGRTGFAVAPGASSSVVAAAFASAFVQMLTVTGKLQAFLNLGGATGANLPGMTAGTFVLVSARPYQQAVSVSETGAFTAAAWDADGHPGIYRPRFVAGIRPAPWLVDGSAWAGFANHRVD